MGVRIDEQIGDGGLQEEDSAEEEGRASVASVGRIVEWHENGHGVQITDTQIGTTTAGINIDQVLQIVSIQEEMPRERVNQGDLGEDIHVLAEKSLASGQQKCWKERKQERIHQRQRAKRLRECTSAGSNDNSKIATRQGDI
jgi:hypothetical protein